MRIRSILLGLLAFVALGINAAPASADEFDDLVANAMKAYGDGDYDTAIELFFKAKLIDDAPGLVYNIARSYDNKGDCLAAQKYYKQVLDREDTDDGTREKAKEKSDLLGECPTKGTLSLVCVPADATVQIDGNPLGPCGNYELEQGEYALVVSALGYIPQDSRVTIQAEKVEAQTITLGIADPTPVGGGPDLGPNWLGIGLTAGGGVFILGAVIVDVVNITTNVPELEKRALDDPTRDSFEEAYEGNATAIYVLGGIGVATLAAGAVLWALDVRIGGEEQDSDPSAMQWHVTPTVSASGDLGAFFGLTF